MRGLIPAHFMTRIEDATGLRMTDMVDVFTGPSTGAILNAALNVPDPDNPSRPKYKAQNLVRFYEREGLKIFPPDRFRAFRGLVHDFNNRTMKISQLRNLFRHGNYDAAHLSTAMKNLFGQTKLAESLNSLVIPFYCLDGDHLEVVEEKGEDDNTPVPTKNNFVDHGGYAVWLKNMRYGHNRKPTPDVLLKDAIMASTAAPTYFPSHHFNVGFEDLKNPVHYAGIDGSIFDNPPISYHGAVNQHIPPDTRVIMILLGTGHNLRSFKGEDWNRFGSLGVVDPVNDLPLINILFHASETALVESFSQDVDELFVFNKSLIGDTDQSGHPSEQIDDASPENLKKMKTFAEETLEEQKSRFDQLCHLLVQNYEQKQKRKPFWQKWF